MADRRYSATQAARLLTRLTGVRELSVRRARTLFRDLLSARLGDVAIGAVDETVDATSDSDIATLQQSVFSYLGIAVGADRAPAARRWPGFHVKNVRLDMGGADMTFRVSGSLPAMLTVQLHALFRMVGVRLRQCGCGAVYVKVRRQRYCSDRCQKRYYMRRFRAGEAGSESWDN